MSYILNFKNWVRVYEAAGSMTALDTLQKLADKYGETLYTSADGLTKSTARFKITDGAAGIDDPVAIANFTEPTPGTLYLKLQVDGKKVKEGNVSLTAASITNVMGIPISKDFFSDGAGAVEVTKVAHDMSDKYRPMSPIAGVIARAISDMSDVRMKHAELGGGAGADESWIITSRLVMAHEVDFGRSNKKYVDETTGKVVTPTQKP
jgi:hypothetical protein